MSSYIKMLCARLQTPAQLRSHKLDGQSGNTPRKQYITAKVSVQQRRQSSNMHRLAVAAILAFTVLTRVSSQLPCTSQLRLLYPQYFTHCDCRYSEWSEWVMDPASAVSVPTSQCPSGQALNEMRTRTVIAGSGCNDRTETRQICAPDREDRLIMALGLGSSGHDLSAVLQGPTACPFCFAPVRPANCRNSGIACHHVTVPHGKRSLQDDKEESLKRIQRSKPDPLPLANDPVPFEWSEHGKRFRRQTFSGNRDCHPDGIQHILFMLDTSGSIRVSDFNRMTSSLGKLTRLLCKPIKIAAMTFNHDYHIEFCFNCYDNQCSGRLDVSNAMRNIPYRGGWTHTAGAVRCACDVLLHQSCGVVPSASCIDVVVITDGRSNDPSREVCNEIRCLHDRFGVNTYAIGIGNADHNELNCIRDESNPMGIFSYRNFADFENGLRSIIHDRLLNPHYARKYSCIDSRTQNGLGTNSCLVP